jgi:hypothetical protein
MTILWLAATVPQILPKDSHCFMNAPFVMGSSAFAAHIPPFAEVVLAFATYIRPFARVVSALQWVV